MFDSATATSAASIRLRMTAKVVAFSNGLLSAVSAAEEIYEAVAGFSVVCPN